MQMPSRLRVSAAVVAAVIGFAAVGTALAQDTDPIERRQDLMKQNGQAAKTASQMLKKEVAFDPAKAMEVLTALQTTAEELPSLFPEDSMTGHDTEAAPAIWEKPDEFKAALDKYQADATQAVAAAPQDLQAFQQAFGMVAGNCRSCHETFRIDK
ncbi:c-type cytochrome [Consotaella aegiceratis]|uniref:c-type cytochrome n=1 Tax=Consotaella aegiceratis TaxID=3097961 RepID=UPI002F407F93